MSDWKEAAQKRKLARQSGDQQPLRRQSESKKPRGKYVIQMKYKKRPAFFFGKSWNQWTNWGSHYRRLEDAQKALSKRRTTPSWFEAHCKWRLGIEERVDGKLVVTPIKGEKGDTTRH